MAISPTTGGPITLSRAQVYLNAFKSKYPLEKKASFMGVDNIRLIIDQPNCIGIRVYNGYDDVEKNMVLVMVGVDSNERDMTNGFIMNRMASCPADCDIASSLMV